ncbi:MAG TPA: hypothetical protein VGY58_13900 [Gemmataceae bacterium]|nr:hypothetical protein [Gemmataceae bacterium]
MTTPDHDPFTCRTAHDMLRHAFGVGLLAALIIGLAGCGKSESKSEPYKGEVSYKRFPHVKEIEQKKTGTP